MNYPVWALPAPGLLIAAVGIVRVFVSHFAVGGGLFLVLAERKARADSDAAVPISRILEHLGLSPREKPKPPPAVRKVVPGAGRRSRVGDHGALS